MLDERRACGVLVSPYLPTRRCPTQARSIPHEDSPRSERDATRYASQLAEKPRARISSATSTSTSSSREIDDEYLLEQASHTAVQILAVDTFC